MGLRPVGLEEVGDHGVVEGVALVLELGDAHDGGLDLASRWRGPRRARWPGRSASAMLTRMSANWRRARWSLVRARRAPGTGPPLRGSRGCRRGRLPRERMSSRSKGVMKVGFRASKIWRVIWSPSCSMALSCDGLDPPVLEAGALRDLREEPGAPSAGSRCPDSGARGSALRGAWTSDDAVSLHARTSTAVTIQLTFR